VWIDGQPIGVTGNSTIKGLPFYYEANAADGRNVMWPINAGDSFQWNIRVIDSTSPAQNNLLYFIPLGLSKGGDALTTN
jgi:hypothetical protein